MSFSGGARLELLHFRMLLWYSHQLSVSHAGPMLNSSFLFLISASFLALLQEGRQTAPR